MIYFKPQILKPQKIQVVYRVFPISFSAPYPPEKYKLNKPLPKSKPDLLPLESDAADGEENRIIANGIITRGIGAGNNQNMTMNSDMNLQLKGRLYNDLQIEAFLSDKNLPVEADGYSQQIQAFDQIYIKVYDSLRMIQMGDINLAKQDDGFMRFNRKLQGVKAGFTSNNNMFSAGAAVAKGTYHRQVFNGIEGVQGPYRLNGANNELYIVVLAGTERVFLDGIILERGEKADYTIDYNTAQIVFTPRHLLTANSRVIVEFEYSDRNYNRFTLFAQNMYRNKKTEYIVAFYSESDAKNQPVDQQMSDYEKEIMANAGDELDDAVITNFDSVDFNINLVLYKMIDTVVNAISYDSIFVQSYNSDSAFYQVGFAYTGPQNGDYILINSSANGKVYKWVAPIAGVHQGDYQPVKQLVAPYKKQMLSVSAKYTPTKNITLNIETAFSDYDKNTYSTRDNNDNKGLAGKFRYSQLLGKNTLKARIELEGQTLGETFTAIERFREAEFERNWNLQQQPSGHQYQGGITISLFNKDKTPIRLLSQILSIGNQYTGFRNGVTINHKLRKSVIYGQSELHNSYQQENSTRFYQHSFDIKYPIKKLAIGIKQQMEDYRIALTKMDSLLPASQKFFKTTGYIQTRDTSMRKGAILYSLRSDFTPVGNNFKPITQSHDLSANLVLASSDKSHLDATLTWRRIEANALAARRNIKSDNLLTSQINQQLKIVKGIITINTFYENATAMENHKEFIYVEVATGKGIYIWNDYNQNGAPELDEFEVSAYPEEANYIRVYTPSSDYIKVYSAKWSETFRVNPAIAWKGKEGIRGFVSRFSNDLTFRSTVKHTNNAFIKILSPVGNAIDDTMLQNWSQNVRNAFSFNRNHPIFALDWIYTQNGQKNLMANGFETNRQNAQQVKLRWNLNSRWMVTNSFELKERKYYSEYFTSKNFDIKSTANQFAIQWQPTVKLRWSVDYYPEAKRNINNNEKSVLQRIGANAKISVLNQGVFSLRFDLIHINYNSTTDNPIAYEMLDGNQPGRNYKLTFNFQQNIGKYLQLSMNYFARKPESSKTIHTGQVNLSAIF